MREEEERVKQVRGLAELRNLSFAATTTTEYRVVSQFNSEYSKFKDSPRKYKHYSLIGERNPSREDAESIARVVSDPRSYRPPGQHSTCLPDPGYIVKFETARGPVEVLVCFSCGDVWVNGVKDLENTTLGIAPEATKALLPRATSLGESAT